MAGKILDPLKTLFEPIILINPIRQGSSSISDIAIMTPGNKSVSQSEKHTWKPRNENIRNKCEVKEERAREMKRIVTMGGGKGGGI